MQRLALGALVLAWTSALPAQRVPGRDLLSLPLGLTAEAPALGSGVASGFWNPATGLLENGERIRLGAAALSAPVDLGLSGQMLLGSYAVPKVGTLSVSLAHAAVTDLIHTETDPQSIGDEIPYTTLLASVGIARRVQTHMVVGADLRWHNGQAESRQGNAAATDVGVLFDHLTTLDARVGASTFLWTLHQDDGPMFAFAGDVRVAGRDSSLDVRAGLSYTRTKDAADEAYPYLEGRIAGLTVRGGLVKVDEFGANAWRLRLGVALQHGGYTLSIVRDDNESGLSPSYQISIANVLR